MRRFVIVMTDPLGGRSPQMPVAERNQRVETVSTGCPDHAFTKGVRLSTRTGVFTALRCIDVSAVSTAGA